MKKFIIFFTISIISSGLILTILYFLSFTPLDPKNGTLFSNGLITGLILIGIGTSQFRSNQYTVGNRDNIIYGVHEDNNDTNKL